MLPETFTPDLLRRLELLRIRARRAYLGARQGGHISPRKGHGIEFSDYRKYEPGDSPRNIDWGLYARSDRLYVKTYQEEQNISVLCVVDTSASMFTSLGGGKWERARDVALALSYVALMGQEEVILCVPGLKAHRGFCGPRSIHSIAGYLSEAVPCDANQIRVEILQAVTRIRYPGSAILISDFLMPLDDIRRYLDILRAKNLDVTAIQILSPFDLDPFSMVRDGAVEDSETGRQVDLWLEEGGEERYRAMLGDHIDKVVRMLSEMGIACAMANSDQDFFSFLSENLWKTGLLR